MIPVQDAILDRETVDRLFFDIAHAAELLGVTTKGGAETMAGSESQDLEAARRALHERRVFGVQLRYRHAGTEWWDTLMATPHGIRLIRIDHGAALRSPAGE